MLCLTRTGIDFASLGWTDLSYMSIFAQSTGCGLALLYGVEGSLSPTRRCLRASI
jgi:hypothetical protein